MEKYWRTLGGRLVNVIRLSVFANWRLSKLGFYPASRDWEMVLRGLHFKGMTPGSFRQTSLSCNWLGEELALKGAGKEFPITSFLK